MQPVAYRIRLPWALLGVTREGRSLSPVVVLTGMSPSAALWGGRTGVVDPDAALVASLSDQFE